jgi:hypothetical protein
MGSPSLPIPPTRISIPRCSFRHNLGEFYGQAMCTEFSIRWLARCPTKAFSREYTFFAALRARVQPERLPCVIPSRTGQSRGGSISAARLLDARIQTWAVPAATSIKIEADEGRTDNWLSAKKAKPHASLVPVQIAMSAGGFEVRQRRFARCDFRRANSRCHAVLTPARGGALRVVTRDFRCWHL